MNRVPVDLGIEAFRATGLIPAQRVTGEGRSGCGLAVVERYDPELFWLLSDEYVQGFVEGFDGMEPSPPSDGMKEYYVGYAVGYADGAELWAAVADGLPDPLPVWESA